MPKIKTNRAAAKRFRVTGSGKIKRNKGFKSHLLSSKGKKRKRKLRRSTLVSAVEAKNIRKLIPYKKVKYRLHEGRQIGKELDKCHELRAGVSPAKDEKKS